MLSLPSLDNNMMRPRVWSKSMVPEMHDSDTTATDDDDNQLSFHPKEFQHPPLTSLEAPISPPPSNRRRLSSDSQKIPTAAKRSPDLAALQAGEVTIQNHLEYLSEHLSRYVRREGRLMEMETWKELYRRNCHAEGRHFVVHQHDHPIAGR